MTEPIILKVIQNAYNEWILAEGKVCAWHHITNYRTVLWHQFEEIKEIGLLHNIKVVNINE